MYRALATHAPNRRLRHQFLWLAGILFALHHTIIIQGWFTWWQWLLVTIFLALVGVLFNWFYEKSGSIWPGWLAHTAADATIVIIGLFVFGVL